MKLTKTWLSYIVWGLFSIIFFANIGISAIEIYIKNEMSDFWMPMIVLYGGTIVGIICIVGIFKLVEKYILPKIKKEETEINKAVETFALVMVVFVAIALRAISIIASSGTLDGTTEYFDYAISGGAQASFGASGNGAYLYTGILRFVLDFLGHMPTAAMCVQTGIQMIAIICAFFFLKKSLGRVAAWVSLILLSFLPGSFLAVRSCTPDILFVLFFVLYLWALLFLCQANKAQKIRGRVHILYYICMGAFAAFLSYYDIAGIVCVVIGIVAFIQFENEEAWLKIQKPVMQNLLFCLGFVISLLLMVWALPTGGVESGPASLIAYFTSFISSSGLNLMIMSPHKGQWDCVALFILAGLWFVGFLRTKQDKGFPFVILIVFLTLKSFLGIGLNDYTMLSGFLWIVLATIGLVSINDFRKNDRDVEIAERNKENTAKRKAERERKRDEASGEKSIRLDNIDKKKAMEEPALKYKRGKKGDVSIDDIEIEPLKKSYGIGRKADTMVESVEKPVVEDVKPTPETPSEYTSVAAPTGTYSVNESSYTASAGVQEGKTIVKKVDRPPLGMSSPTPVYSTYNPGVVYTQPSRSRRSLRTPSKSTFTREDLERISRYTGVSYMASHTVISPAKDDEPEFDIEETTPVSASDVVADVNENVVSANDATHPAEGVSYIELPDNVVPEQTPVEEMSNIKPEESVPQTESNIAEISLEETSQVTETVAEEETTTSSDNNDTEQKTQNEQVEISVTPGIVYNPSRRHYRHPSKSTFSPEELERIRQFTNNNYQNSFDNNLDVSDIAQEDKDSPVKDYSSKKTVAVVGAPVTNGVDQNNVRNDKQNESGQKTRMIRNPLPGPKPHVARELNYDYIPKESEMDYDIKDMRGKDYFDL